MTLGSDSEDIVVANEMQAYVLPNYIKMDFDNVFTVTERVNITVTRTRRFKPSLRVLTPPHVELTV